MARITDAYAEQVKALRTLQSPNRAKRQVIKVQKHVTVTHYHDEKHLHVTPGGGGGKSNGQAQASEPLRAGATLPGTPLEVAALPGPDASGEVVSFPGREGEAGLPDARRRERIGSAKR